MGTRIKDFENRPHFEKSFTEDGVLIAAVRKGEDRLRVVVEQVGSGNEIQPQGKLTGQAAWQNIGSAIAGVSAGVDVDVSDYDEWQLVCSTFEDDGAPKVIVSGFF